ncbi:MAG: class I SAM-dependent rRNA methyltransferase [Kiritimatiellae bacterium]|nr:class I SAM-dependent rRNA methyltransferase [Kiritimatiellia bacterium]
MDKVFLRQGRDKPTRGGHPWIFSGAVERVQGHPGAGDAVEVFSAKGDVLGIGAFSPVSQIRVRMLPCNGDADTLVRRAVERRKRFFEGAEGTDAFRLVHAEADGLPGVVADWYAGWISVQFSTAWAEKNKVAIAEALMSATGAKGVYNRSDVAARKREGLDAEGAAVEGSLCGEDAPEKVVIREGEMHLYVDIRHGHKTGYYLDQRDARRRVAAYCVGRRVLNCFSYTGGFGVAAMLAGAAHVTNVDSSAPALAEAKANACLNGVEMEYREADVFAHLRRLRDANERFDVIILDPPKFAESKGQLMRALRGYKDINLLAMKLLAPGGTLATFSCSGAVTSDIFDTVLREAAQDARRDMRIVERTRQGADHPVALAFPESEYLKGAILQ